MSGGGPSSWFGHVNPHTAAYGRGVTVSRLAVDGPGPGPGQLESSISNNGKGVGVDSKTLTFLGLISGPRQYRIPPFQRAYSWEREERETLWLDMLTQYERLTEVWHLEPEERDERISTMPSHYLGTVVLSGPSALGVPRSDVIDGQQRITTLMLAICALRDVWSKSIARSGRAADAEAAGERRRVMTDTYLRNAGAQGEERARLIPLTIDRKAFDGIVQHSGDGRIDADALELSDGHSQRVIQAYRFFNTEMRRRAVNPASNPQLARFAGLFPLDYEVLEQVIAHRMSVIAIETKSLDDTNAIFESLNAKGKPLGQLDLLRNYVFMLLRGRANEVLRDIWEPMETVHLRPAEVEQLVWADLVSRGTNVLQKRSYRTVQAQLREGGATAAVAENYVRELHRKSLYFRRILHPTHEEHDDLRRALGRLNEVGGRTARPVVLWLYEQIHLDRCDHGIAAQCIGDLESYLVRRFIAGLAPNNLNSQFGTMLTRLNEASVPGEDVRDRLQRVMLMSSKDWPDDDAIVDAVLAQDFYHNGDTSQRMLILRSIDSTYGYELPPNYIESDKSIEHILPQSRTTEWIGDLRAVGEELHVVQERYLNSLANLTLIAPEVNSSLGAKGFSVKVGKYATADYKMTRAVAEFATRSGVWGTSSIRARAEDIATRVLSLWHRPSPLLADAAPSDAVAEFAASELDEFAQGDDGVFFTSSIDEDAVEEE